jgi:hypothetical protein
MNIKREELAYFRSKPALIDTLIILIENGPCEPGDLLHTDHTQELLASGYACHVVVKLDDGWYAATMKGRDLYKRLFDTSLGGPCHTLREAYANRVAARTLKEAGTSNG